MEELERTRKIIEIYRSSLEGWWGGNYSEKSKFIEIYRSSSEGVVGWRLELDIENYRNLSKQLRGGGGVEITVRNRNLSKFIGAAQRWGGG